MVAVKVDFSSETLARIKVFAGKFPFAIDKATEQAATFGKGLVVKFTPVKTGDARKSWEVDRAKGGAGGGYSYMITSRVGRGANYTPFLEYGTGLRGPKRQWIRPKTAMFLVFPIIKGNTIKGWVRTLKTAGMRKVGMIENNKEKIKEKLTANVTAIIRKWGT